MKTRYNLTFRTVAVLSLLAGAAACSSEVSGPGTPGREPEGQPPLEAVRPFATAELAAASSSNSFGVKLFHTIAAADASPNLIISPLSASMALGMTLNGAEDSTLNAIRNVLGFNGKEIAAINESYRGLIAQLRARGGKTEFRLANSIWYRAGFDLQQPFIDATRTSFNAHVEALDFTRADAPKIISKWAEDVTGGRIRDLVEEVNPEDMLFLINAVYFKSPWHAPFSPQATSNRPFTRADGSTVSVPTMMETDSYATLDNAEVQAVELLYADTTFSMVLIAPPANGSLSQFAAALTPQKWNAWMSALRRNRVMLTMPKFKFEYDITMNDALKAQGMGIAFDWQRADFDRMPAKPQDDLHISQVRQKAFIDVHELGTEAAAATSVTVGVTSMPPSIQFDRAFLFAIRERASGTILFMGRVGDPSK